MKIIMHVYSREQKVSICLFWLLQLWKKNYEQRIVVATDLIGVSKIVSIYILVYVFVKIDKTNLILKLYWFYLEKKHKHFFI